MLCFGAFLSTGFTPGDGFWARKLQQGKMNLPVHPLVQSLATSCGEAAIVMAYNYAYPESRLSEQDVINYASAQGYFTEQRFPFTSPDNMVRIAEHYADTATTGVVSDKDEALSLLVEKLTGGDPVIIDVFTLLYDPRSGPHFIVVTGLEYDPANPDATRIYYNDPLLNKNRVHDWLGREGIWNAWQNNGDPGGSGWWMMISSP